MKPNVEIIVRERGKLVTRRESHNIWTQSGKGWLARLVSFASFDPDVLAEDYRLRYMGFGIGSELQNNIEAFVPPLSTDYAGSNLQTNRDNRVSRLERPVLFNASDYYKQFDAVDLVTPYHIRFTVYVAPENINLSGAYLGVPISEVGLFLRGISLTSPSAAVMAYDAFEPIHKSYDQDMTVYWTLRLK